MTSTMTRLQKSQTLQGRREAGSLAWLALLGLAFVCGSARADDAPAAGGLGAQIATSGTNKGAPACSACHGANGEGQDGAGIPRLAGLDAAYIARQFASFEDGSRSNDTMKFIVTNLTAADRDAVAKYYAALPAPKLATSMTPVNAAGQELAQRGAWGVGVPPCASCHGAQGQGVGASFPPLAGQPSSYIVSQFNAWRDGSRHNDPMGLMHGIATRLSDAQIADVAAYYAMLSAQSGPPNASATSKSPTDGKVVQ
ncbi:MAG: c-type cytochrome [Methylocella sp.]